ncbi:N-succinylarginine dihydrolase [Acidithiobacillus marinus]|uniref:N-succinylarginine dihydrolase n=1 Tax=Acidithiobacillus marinus TaxID=187490 RepID=A0A2I1DNB2_9PROT|nr:N-succinylarginine dihydrolase [Acidithiobacillus marinus]PKY11357.1 N-succinylarginine dihydrolase [Acidithiobacillus marinus]
MIEMNMDGLVGPSHHYAGLSHGNLASKQNALQVANPKAAALQGLDKMRYLFDLGLPQCIFPPSSAPKLHVLRTLGFTGSNAKIIEGCARTSPELLSQIYSSSAMWAANAACISSSADTLDGKTHFTPANLNSTFHRSLETTDTTRFLKLFFSNEDFFIHHSSLPNHSRFGDEGAANHCRLSLENNAPGISLFIYGRSSFNRLARQPQKFPARQTLEASQAIARSHGLNPDLCFFVQQNPEAIDQGAFHNDVVSVTHKNIMFCHEQAFLDQDKLRQKLISIFNAHDENLHWIEVPARRIPLAEAIKSYIFNSQIITTAQNKVILLVPNECRENIKVWDYLHELCLDENYPFSEIKTIDLSQSMRNGGGPACLRLRIPLTSEALETVHPGIVFSEQLDQKLRSWVNQYYRDRLHADDLADPLLLKETQEALYSLGPILQTNALYDF